MINEKAYIRNILRCSGEDIIEKFRRKELRKFLRLRSNLDVMKKLMINKNKHSNLIIIKKKFKDKRTKLKNILDCFE